MCTYASTSKAEFPKVVFYIGVKEQNFFLSLNKYKKKKKKGNDQNTPGVNKI